METQNPKIQHALNCLSAADKLHSLKDKIQSLYKQNLKDAEQKSFEEVKVLFANELGRNPTNEELNELIELTK